MNNSRTQIMEDNNINNSINNMDKECNIINIPSLNHDVLVK